MTKPDPDPQNLRNAAVSYQKLSEYVDKEDEAQVLLASIEIANDYIHDLEEK